MKIRLKRKGDLPVYRQIADAIAEKIVSGELGPGERIETVREMAHNLSVSLGTVKHAYLTLKDEGLIEMTQGKGTFVCGKEEDGTYSQKGEAMKLIDNLFDEMVKLGFSMREISIFFDLKMRAREEGLRDIAVGIVECSVEARRLIAHQMREVDDIEIMLYRLEDIIDQKTFGENLDLVITTNTHFKSLLEKVEIQTRIIPLALSISPMTILAIGRIVAGKRVGVLTKTTNYSRNIHRALESYSLVPVAEKSFICGMDHDFEGFLDGLDYCIVPEEVEGYLTAEQLKVYAGAKEKGLSDIVFRYDVDQGSLLYIHSEIEEIQSERNRKRF